jgi:hypothetical protein
MEEDNNETEVIEQLIEKLDKEQTKQFISYLHSVIYLE